MWEALGWGAVAASSLVIGAVLASLTAGTAMDRRRTRLRCRHADFQYLLRVQEALTPAVRYRWRSDSPPAP
jgi:hypothetical protein